MKRKTGFSSMNIVFGIVLAYMPQRYPLAAGYSLPLELHMRNHRKRKGG